MFFVALLNDGDVPAALVRWGADALTHGRFSTRVCILIIALLSLSLWAGIAALVRILM